MSPKMIEAFWIGQVYAYGWEGGSVEGDLWVLNATFAAVEY